jgi:hypothetical protein
MVVQEHMVVEIQSLGHKALASWGHTAPFAWLLRPLLLVLLQQM